MKKYYMSKAPLLLINMTVLLSLSACSVVDNFVDTTRTNLDYSNNVTVKDLDVPPDLTAPEYDMAFVLPANGVISASEMRGGQSSGYTRDGRKINVLPQRVGIRLGGLGQSRWLDVSASAEVLWPKIRDFWRAAGIPVKRDEPRIGIMQTDWVVNRAGLPLNWFNKALGSIIGDGYDAGTRDRFRIRVEKPSSSSTPIFLTHKGAEKVVTDTLSGWELRPPNREVEAEMLNRLKVFLQGDAVGATRNTGSKNEITRTSSLVNIITQDGFPVMQIHDNYKRSWVLTGIMMDRMGLVVEKRNQSAGIYNVVYQGDDEDTAKRGYFSRIFGGRRTLLIKGEDYQVHVQDTGKLSQVRIMDEEGKPLDKRLAQLVLVRLKQEFDR